MLILPLNAGHDRKGFDCGDSQLNAWFCDVARQHQQKGVSSTFVAVSEIASTEVLGFYALSLAELVNADLPALYRKRLPGRVPAFRLGRLAVAQIGRGKRTGELLLFDAIDRVTRIASEVGGIGMVVDAKDSAVDFYRRYGFEQMSDHPHHLLLTLY